MRAVGLITEYNPFHNGHLHHLRESLKAASAEVSVAVMSGHFLQRGEPALVDKWVRTDMALAAGVDVVVELPLPWACSSAPDFARGGVQALELLGGVEALCFGSESGDLTVLSRCADLLSRHADEVRTQTAALLRQGQSYPEARAAVLSGLVGSAIDTAQWAAPNNILGIEYLKALQRTGKRMQAFTIERIGAGFHQTTVGPDRIASATGIRGRLHAGEAVAELMPHACHVRLRDALQAQQFFSVERYFNLLQAQIFRDAERLDRLWLVENGLAQRLLAAADRAEDLEGLIDTVKARQLTRTRIQRVLMSVLLGWPAETIRGLLSHPPAYLHLLGVSTRGRRFLAGSRTQRRVPLVQNFSRIYSQLKRHYGADSAPYRQALEQLALEQGATRIYRSLLHTPGSGPRNRDFYQPVIHHRDAEKSKTKEGPP